MSDDNQLSKDVIGHFFRSLSRQYPEAGNGDIQRMGNDIISNLSDHMDQGYRPAVARPNFDGGMDLIVLTVERLFKKGRQE